MQSRPVIARVKIIIDLRLSNKETIQQFFLCINGISGSIQQSRDVINPDKETQLMLTNPYDAFRGESRSPNIIPFDMLGIVLLLL